MKQSPARKQARAEAVAAARRLHVATDAYLYPEKGVSQAEMAVRELKYNAARAGFVNAGLAYFIGPTATIASRQRRMQRREKKA